MDISSWITFEPGGAAIEKSDEIDQIAQTKLAQDIQQRLRNQVDPGIDLKSARRAQAIRVQANGGQLVIDEEDQDKLFGGGVAQAEEDDAQPQAGNLDDLFRPGSGVPESVTQQDGSTQLVFRSIKAKDLFGSQVTARRSEMVERVVANVLQSEVVDAVEDAMGQVDRLYPELSQK